MPDKTKPAADEPSAAELAKLKRDDLNEAAAEAGVPDPEALPNKDAVLEAIEAPNPALVPDPVERVEHTYTVVGPVSVLGHAPHAEFTALIPEKQEARLIAAGHIERSDQED